MNITNFNIGEIYQFVGNRGICHTFKKPGEAIDGAGWLLSYD